jgi:hypothetical protein
MLLFSWLKALNFQRYTQPAARRSGGSQRRRKQFLSVVDALEARTLLAAVIWDGGGNDFNWNNELNWSDDTLPGVHDDVTINLGANDFTVVHSTGISSVKSLVSYAGLNVSGGELLLQESSHLFGELTVRGVVGGSADIAVSGLFTWTTGNGQTALRGANGQGSLTANGGAVLDGITYGYVDHNLEAGFRFINPAGRTVDWAAGHITLKDHSYFDNYGTIEQTFDGGLGSFDSASEFNNYGSFIKSGGNSTDGSGVSVGHFNNSGSIDVQVGTLTFGYVGTQGTNTGTIQASSGTILNLLSEQISSGSIHADEVNLYWGSAQISGAFSANKTSVGNDTAITGPLLNLGYLTVTGSLNLTDATFAPGATTFDSLTLSGALTTDEDLTVDGLFTWTTGNGQTALRGANGQGSLTANGGAVLDGITYGYVDHNLEAGFRFINPAGRTVDWAAGHITLTDHSYFDNYGTIKQTFDGVIGSFDSASEFSNYGSFIKSAGTTNLPYGSWVAVGNIHNSGTIDVQVGAVTIGYFSGTYTTNTGTIQGADDTQINLFSVQNSSGVIQGDKIVFATDTATVSGSFQANQTEVQSATTFTGTVLDLGHLTVTGSLNLTDATFAPGATALDSLTLSGTLTTDEDLAVEGLFTWTTGNGQTALRGANGQGSLTVNGGAVLDGVTYGYVDHNLEAGFRLINPTGRTVDWAAGHITLNDQSYFDNYGTIELTFDGGIGSFDSASKFSNYGSLVKTGGNSPGGSLFWIGHFNNNGLIDVQVGTLTIGYVGTQGTNTGTVQASSGTILNLLSDQNSSGSIHADEVNLYWGSAQISGAFSANKTSVGNDVTVTGTVLDFGHLTVTGSLNLTDATFAPGATTFDSLTLSGTLTTDEDLAVDGLFTWTNATLQGDNGSGSLTLHTDTTLSSNLTVRDFTLINAADMTWTGGAALFSGSASRFVNAVGATFDDQIDGAFGSVDGNCIQFVNDGHFVKSGNTGITYLHMQLYNRGTVEIQQGQLYLGCGYVSNNPSNPPAPGIDYPVDHPPEYTNDSPVEIQPGTNPVIVPGSYTQSVTGLLVEQIAGHSGGLFGTPGQDYGQLVVNGNVALNGSLEVQVINPFVPAIGQQFLVIDNRGSEPISGTFTGLIEGAIVWAGNYGFSVSYSGGTGNDFVLTMSQYANSAPVADVGGPYTVAEGGSIGLSAVGSTDAEQDLLTLTYLWDFDNDGIFGETGPDALYGDETDIEPTFVATFLNGPVSVPISLRVVDDGGLVSETSTLVEVTNSNPVVIPNSYTVTENAPMGTVVGAVIATDFVGDVLNYSIVGGTGATAFIVDTATGQIIVADSSQLDYETTNELTLQVLVTDQEGGQTVADLTVFLTNKASLSGVVFVDADGDGHFNADETGIAGVTIELLNAAGDVLFSTLTDSSGLYFFDDLDSGEYQIREVQPSGFADGPEYLGSLGGTIVSNDVMSLTLTDIDAMYYNFSEMGGQLSTGDAAGIGFWQNKHGQSLITQGGAALANWLTASFPNIFGNLLAGANGADVAQFYKEQLFKQKGKNAAGPAKVDAQFMAVALATFFTSSNLAGHVATNYGFNVTAAGIGSKTITIGARGAAFGVPDHSDRTIMQILLATNGLTDQPDHQSGFAYLYDSNGDGVIDSHERTLRAMANDLFDWINSHE